MNSIQRLELQKQNFEVKNSIMFVVKKITKNLLFKIFFCNFTN